MQRILVVAVHPDDETLGCGGTLFKHKNAGDSMAWIIVTNVKKEYGYSEERVISRNAEIEMVQTAYNFEKIYNFQFEPSGLNGALQKELVSSFASAINDFQPEVIYVVNRSDAHSDHRYAFQACYACTKSFRFPFIKKILMYECPSETEFAPATPESVFIPNYFVDITNFLDLKIEVMKIYKSELGTHPFPRSLENIKTIAQYRGTIAGVDYAEAFQLVKFIDK